MSVSSSVVFTLINVCFCRDTAPIAIIPIKSEDTQEQAVQTDEVVSAAANNTTEMVI